MKKDLHPTTYRPVVFQDETAGFAFLTQSTAQTNDTIVWEDGQQYPLVKMYISSATHPFYTGKETTLDIAGNIEKFEARKQAALSSRDRLANKAKKVAAKAAEKAQKAEQKPAGKTPAAASTTPAESDQ